MSIEITKRGHVKSIEKVLHKTNIQNIITKEKLKIQKLILRKWVSKN